jgi:cytochrome c biogenesis protein CcmG/thiol:disulfide interchange protein DsbE
MEPSDHIKNGRSSRSLPLAWLAAAVVGLLVIALLIHGLVARPVSQPKVGEPFPDFQLTAFDGSPMSLGSQRGSIVVINVFGSWCPPCREEAADLERTWREYKERGAQFFGIAFQDQPAPALAYLREFDVTYPTALESDDRTARSFGVSKVPETFVVGVDGLLFYHFVGPVSRAQLSQVLDQALND